MKTSNEQRDDAERTLNNMVQGAMDNAKNPVPATAYDGIAYKERMARENAEREQAEKEAREKARESGQ
jgi:hypothetical protein